jgi:hypothetical protein
MTGLGLAPEMLLGAVGAVALPLSAPLAARGRPESLDAQRGPARGCE